MPPARSTTPAGTEPAAAPARPGWARPVLAAVLVATGLAALTQLGAAPPDPAPRAAPPAPAGAAAPEPVPPTIEGRRIVFGGAPGPIRQRVTAQIGAAITAVDGFWGTDWPTEIVIETVDSDREFTARTGLSEPMAAAAVAGWVDPARGIAAGQAIVIAPGAAGIGDDALQTVLTHELFHYATRAHTALDAPRWLQEGVADYVARPAPRHPAVPDRLPDDADFTGTGAALSAGYDRAWLLARFIAERYGPDRLRALYAAGAGPGHPDPDTALRRTLGVDPAELFAQWRATA